MSDKQLQPSFTVAEVFSQSQKMLEGNWLRYFGLLAVILLLGVPSYALDIYAEYQTGDALSALSQLISFLVSGVAAIAMVRFALEVVDGKRSDFWSLFKMDGKMYGSVLLGMLAYLLVVALGIIALIVPGIILALMFGFYGYAIVEKGAGPFQSFGISKKLTEGNKTKIFSFWALIVLLSFAIIGIPLMVFIPLAIFLTTQGAAAGAIIAGVLGIALLIVIIAAFVYLGAVQTIGMAFMYRRMTETRKLA